MVRHQYRYEDEQQYELVGWNVATAATASATTEAPFAAAAATTTEYAG